jgi:hypothetical protein
MYIVRGRVVMSPSSRGIANLVVDAPRAAAAQAAERLNHWREARQYAQQSLSLWRAGAVTPPPLVSTGDSMNRRCVPSPHAMPRWQN